MRIGAALAAARERAGLDLAEVEQRTKIRAKYLQALEDEAWQELPSGAYAKGYLRSYAELLGLDADTLVDEFRRQVEGREGVGPEAGAERILAPGQHRPSPGAPGTGPGIALLIGLGALLAIAVLVGVALLSGEGDDGDEPRAPREERKRERPGRERRQAAASGPVELGLAVESPVEVCLLGEGGEALIDGQVLAAGSRDEYVAKRFELRFPSGFKPRQLELELAGREQRLPRARGPVAFRITAPARIREAPAPRRRCP